jgi:hypothetical protein
MSEAQTTVDHRARAADPLRVVCVVSFLDEQRHLARFLASMAAQERPPDLLVLVDDGSSDASPAIATEWARGRRGVRLLRRPVRARDRDRLAQAAELRAFQDALSEIEELWDVAVKMDADLELGGDLFATLERAFLADPDLGIAGAHLSVVDPLTGVCVRERCPRQHVRGATKFYRRACLEQISPIPAILGWDTIDEIAARKLGWRTGSLDCPGAGALHLRPTGSGDGLLRAQYRWGVCAYGIGQHPVWVLLSATRRLGERPYVLGGAAFLAGWAGAPLRRRPRAAGDVRAYGRREQLATVWRRARRTVPA